MVNPRAKGHNRVMELDTLFEKVKWFPRNAENESIKTEKDWGRYHAFRIYILGSREVNDDEAEKINAEMHFVMTGDRSKMEERTERL